jgi:CDGSH-type Zn-finger protein/uncharacterized Fe-S cluster protein YjdI
MNPEAPPGSAAEEANLPIIKRYTAGDVTVVWKPALCIHSKICWHELPRVFNPRVRPWINMNGADADKIIAQVERCPSGALSVERASAAIAEAGGTQVQVLKDGPLIVQGTQRITHADGREELVETKAAYCRCGASGKKPFCDGSHTRIGFRDEASADDIMNDRSAAG